MISLKLNHLVFSPEVVTLWAADVIINSVNAPPPTPLSLSPHHHHHFKLLKRQWTHQHLCASSGASSCCCCCCCYTGAGSTNSYVMCTARERRERQRQEISVKIWARPWWVHHPTTRDVLMIALTEAVIMLSQGGWVMWRRLCWGDAGACWGWVVVRGGGCQSALIVSSLAQLIGELCV